jgi:hypothetical protein
LTQDTPDHRPELDACLGSIERLCVERGIPVERQLPAPAEALRFTVVFDGQVWTLEVDCIGPRYSALPKVRLLTPLPLLAHVSYEGGVCISDSQGLSIDIDRRADVVGYSVGLAIDLLKNSLTDAAGDRAEFYNEFEGYWHGMPRAFMARAAFDVDERDRLITGHIETRDKSRYWYFTEKDVPPPDEFRIKNAEKFRALYVVMPEPEVPPAPGEELTMAYVERIVAKFTPLQESLWNELLGPTMNSRKQVALFVAVPRRDGGLSVNGMAFKAYKRKLEAADRVLPVNIRRHTTAYMRARGGASSELAAKHVVVIGCGSVGSEVADALASSGVGQLTLVDPDRFSEDNVFRHVLGPSWVGWRKAYGLQSVLQGRYPGLCVNPSDAYAQIWLQNADLTKVDGIVLAIGMPTVERLLLRKLRESGCDIPAVIAWLEPLDLGGHAVGVHLQGEGCLDCLYRDEEGVPDLVPRTAFMVPGQKVSRNLTGCASAFVPYGALQSRKTALLATQLMLDALGGEPMPAYRFYSGSGTTAAAEGLRTTHWWQLAKSTSNAEGTALMFGRPCANCRSPS